MGSENSILSAVQSNSSHGASDSNRAESDHGNRSLGNISHHHRSSLIQSSPLDDNYDAKLKEIRKMDERIRARIRQGVQYNMKILIRGSRGTGKTTLWNRMQGSKFINQYVPSPEIQTATMDWMSINSEDNVKVEIWDVVDKGFLKNAKNAKVEDADLDDLTITEVSTKNQTILDATVVDVYKDANGLICLINPFSRKSLDYARKVLRKVPKDIAVIILVNFRDKMNKSHIEAYKKTTPTSPDQPEESKAAAVNDGETIEVTVGDIRSLVLEVRHQRGSGGDEAVSNVFACEVSLFDCFGLVSLNKFLNVPFLKLKKHSLELQLRRTTSHYGEIRDAIMNGEPLSFGEELWSSPVGQKAFDTCIRLYETYSDEYKKRNPSAYDSSTNISSLKIEHKTPSTPTTSTASASPRHQDKVNAAPSTESSKDGGKDKDPLKEKEEARRKRREARKQKHSQLTEDSDEDIMKTSSTGNKSDVTDFSKLKISYDIPREDSSSVYSRSKSKSDDSPLIKTKKSVDTTPQVNVSSGIVQIATRNTSENFDDLAAFVPENKKASSGGLGGTAELDKFLELSDTEDQKHLENQRRIRACMKDNISTSPGEDDHNLSDSEDNNKPTLASQGGKRLKKKKAGKPSLDGGMKDADLDILEIPTLTKSNSTTIKIKKVKNKIESEDAIDL